MLGGHFGISLAVYKTRVAVYKTRVSISPEVMDYASLGISVFDRCDSGWCSRIRRHRWHGGGYRSGFILRFHSVVSRRAPHGQGSGVAALAREITGAGINGALARRRIGDTFAGRAECWPVTAR